MADAFSVFLIYLIVILAIGVYAISYLTLNLLVKLAMAAIFTTNKKILHKTAALTDALRLELIKLKHFSINTQTIRR